MNKTTGVCFRCLFRSRGAQQQKSATTVSLTSQEYLGAYIFLEIPRQSVSSGDNGTNAEGRGRDPECTERIIIDYLFD